LLGPAVDDEEAGAEVLLEVEVPQERLAELRPLEERRALHVREEEDRLGRRRRVGRRRLALGPGVEPPEDLGQELEDLAVVGPARSELELRDRVEVVEDLLLRAGVDAPGRGVDLPRTVVERDDREAVDRAELADQLLRRPLLPL